jgi:hypothetical protein
LDKHQIPNTKFQIISNLLNSKLQTKSFWSFGIGVWELFGICNLGFGISRNEDDEIYFF